MSINFNKGHERVIFLRKLCRVSQREFCEKASFANMLGVATLRLIESNKRSMTEYTAKKIIERATELGIECTLDWLLNNIGTQPKKNVDFSSNCSSEARGERLSHLMAIAKLNDEEVTSTVSANTIQGWRHGKFGGVNVNAAEDIIYNLQQAGVNTTAEWLLLGNSLKPMIGETAEFNYKKHMLSKVIDMLNTSEVKKINFAHFSCCILQSFTALDELDNCFCYINDNIFYGRQINEKIVLTSLCGEKEYSPSKEELTKIKRIVMFS